VPFLCFKLPSIFLCFYIGPGAVMCAAVCSLFCTVRGDKAAMQALVVCACWITFLDATRRRRGSVPADMQEQTCNVWVGFFL
jgi:hypothetical protein